MTTPVLFNPNLSNIKITQTATPKCAILSRWLFRKSKSGRSFIAQDFKGRHNQNKKAVKIKKEFYRCG